MYAVFQRGETDLVMYVAADERRALITETPDAFEEITTGRGTAVEEFITVHLPAADTAQVRELLEDAWRRFAPKRAIDAYDRPA